ncbi:hypothetical protein H633G_11357 [Metarhizium anisopliae BRIP 53284]|nr:hypothetical protein H633G_11357 [Metarhizium anisopliae BRIP 53284]
MARNTVDGNTAPNQQLRRRPRYERLANTTSTFRSIQPKQSAIEEASRREQAEAIVRALPNLRRRGPPPRKRIPQPSDASSTGGFPSKLVWSRETEGASGDAHLAGVSSPAPLVQTACEEADQRPWKDDVVERRRPQRQGKRNRHPG